ncbi:hypothetical protein [Aquiflexum sp.]|uniref:OB-fold protein n=1 Tax=Aquiflexum sp. TaxID=1872584 RepID=UPI0035942712
MKITKSLKIIIIVAAVGISIALGAGIYMFNMPHRNVQSAKIDFAVSATELVNEYLAGSQEADEKYLDEGGDSKILEVSGKVSKISRDYNDQIVILIKDKGAKAGVSCTLLVSSSALGDQITLGQEIKVKGVIRSGAMFDPDMNMYENVIMEKCDIVSKI